MAGVKIVDLPALGRDLINTDLLEVSLNGGGSRKITGQEIMNASKLAIGSTPIVSGTVGRLLFQGAGNVLSQPSSLFYDAVNNRLGIGTTTPGASLDVVYESTFQSRIDMYGTLYMYNNITSLSGNIWLNNGYAIGDWGTGNNRIEFYSNRLSFFGNGNEALRIVGSTGNLLVNTVTDAGYKFDVNGTARVKGTGTTSVTTAFTVQNSAGTNMMQLRDDNYQLFGGWLAMESSRYIYRANNATGILTLCNDSTVASYVNMYGSSHATLPNVIDFGTASTNRMRIDASGNVGIGTSSPLDFNLVVQGVQQIRASASSFGGLRLDSTSIRRRDTGTFSLGSNDLATALNIFSTNNIGINTTTDAGYKLDVNGTARVSGNITATTIGFANTSRTITFDDAFSGLQYQGFGGHRFRVYNSSTALYQEMLTMVGNQSNLRIGINSETPNASAILDVVSTDKGFLPPRMTNAQRAAIASPAVGLIVYCTDATEGLYVYKSTGWTFMV